MLIVAGGSCTGFRVSYARGQCTEQSFIVSCCRRTLIRTQGFSVNCCRRTLPKTQGLELTVAGGPCKEHTARILELAVETCACMGLLGGPICDHHEGSNGPSCYLHRGFKNPTCDLHGDFKNPTCNLHEGLKEPYLRPPWRLPLSILLASGLSGLFAAVLRGWC